MNFGGAIHLNKTGCCILCCVAFILFLYVTTNRHDNDKQDVANQINLRKLLTIAIQAAENGGEQVVTVKDHLLISSKGKTKEGANDSVTNADFQSHCVMVGTLKHYFPTLVVISEEAKTDCTNEVVDFASPIAEITLLDNEWVEEKDIKVWVDPLDATQEYTEKLYKYVTTMVCVSVKGKPIIGVIHNPFSKETTWAWVDYGKSTNLDTYQISSDNKLKFIVSRSHTGKAVEVVKKMFEGSNVEVIEAGGAGYKALQVAMGKADAYVHVSAIKKWDICAGNAILNAIGGRMTTKNNLLIDYADEKHVVNEDGLVATVKDHSIYINKLKS